MAANDEDVSWEDAVEMQLSRLESRVYGNSDHQKRSKTCIETLATINSRINMATAGREKISNVLKKVDEIEKYLNLESSDTLSDNAKVQLILAEEHNIREYLDQLEQVNNLKDALSSEHIKSAPGLECKLLKLNEIQMKHQEEANALSEEVKQLVDNYNGVINTLTKQFVYWDDVITKLECKAQTKK